MVTRTSGRFTSSLTEMRWDLHPPVAFKTKKPGFEGRVFGWKRGGECTGWWGSGKEKERERRFSSEVFPSDLAGRGKTGERSWGQNTDRAPRRCQLCYLPPCFSAGVKGGSVRRNASRVGRMNERWFGVLCK